MIRSLVRRLRGNELDRILERAVRSGARRFLVFWNRGLGDIALGLYALFARIREAVPAAEIAVLTRQDLAEAFALFDVQRVIVDPRLERGERDGVCERDRAAGVKASDFDVVLDRPDPTGWLASQHGTVVPRLAWKPEHDALAARFPLGDGRLLVGAHVSAETARFYGYVKDWPRGVVACALRRPRRRALRAVRPRAGAAVRPARGSPTSAGGRRSSRCSRS